MKTVPYIRIIKKNVLYLCVSYNALYYIINRPIIDELITERVTHDQFELKIPRCFRDDRRFFLDEMDSSVDNIIKGMKTESIDLFEIQEEEEEGDEEERQYEEKKEKYEVEEGITNDDQSVSQESSKSNIDIAGLMQNENSMPERFQEITDADVLRSLAIKLIQKHIRAMRDRIIINECIYNPIVNFIGVYSILSRFIIFYYVQCWLLKDPEKTLFPEST